MTLIESKRLAARIKQDPRCHVTGWRHWADQLTNGYFGRTKRMTGYELNVVDTRTGYPFVVTGPDDWDERTKAAEWPPLEE